MEGDYGIEIKRVKRSMDAAEKVKRGGGRKSESPFIIRIFGANAIAKQVVEKQNRIDQHQG